MTKVATVKLEDELSQRLEEFSNISKISKSKIIKAALLEYLEDMEDYKIALERINDPNAEFITTEELEKQMESW